MRLAAIWLVTVAGNRFLAPALALGTTLTGWPESSGGFVRTSNRFSSSARARPIPSSTSDSRAASTAGPQALLYQRSRRFDSLFHIKAMSSLTCRLSKRSQPPKDSYSSPDEYQSRRYSTSRSLYRARATFTDEKAPTTSASCSWRLSPEVGLWAATLASRSRSRSCQ